MNREPVLTLGAAIIVLVDAGIALLQAFNVAINATQQVALAGFASAVIGVGSLFARSLVVPVDTANAQIETVAKQEATANSKTINALKFKKGV